MSGLTDAPFRRLVAKLGAGLVISEMTACSALASGDAGARVQAEGAGVPIHAVQLAGCEPCWMAAGARVAEATGADIIDINMGCPAKRVTTGNAGPAIIPDVKLAIRLIDAVVAAVAVPVTMNRRLVRDVPSI